MPCLDEQFASALVLAGRHLEPPEDATTYVAHLDAYCFEQAFLVYLNLALASVGEGDRTCRRED